MRRLPWPQTALACAIDLGTALVSSPVCRLLRATFATPRGPNALVPLLGFVGLCVALYLVRRLPHDRDALAPSAKVLRLGSLLGISTLVSTVTLLYATFHVSVGESTSQGQLPGVVGFLLAWVVVFLLFLPFALLTVGEPEPLPSRLHLLAEGLAVAASNVTALVLVGYFEWLMLDVAHVRGAGKMPPVAFLGLAILIPTFLLVYGAPRVLMLVRRFSVLRLLVLVGTTAWYLGSRFFFTLGR